MTTTRLDADVEQRLARLGETVAGQIGPVTQALYDAIVEQVEGLQHDEVLARLLHASVGSNIETLAHVLRHDLTVRGARPPAAAAEYARRLAHDGVSITALIRAYRLGHQGVVEWGLRELTDTGDDDGLVAATARRFVTITFDYIDAISEGVIAEYETERERWRAHRTSLRTAMVDRVLEGREVAVADAERVLGYRVHHHHVGVVMWVADGAHDAPAFGEHLHRLAVRLGSRGTPLLETRDRDQAWGWIPLRHDGAVPASDDDDASPVRVALGTPTPGLEGLRTSHLEAQQARRVALLAGERARAVTSYADAGVRAAALLGDDLESTRRLVVRALGSLAAPTEGAERLRETLLAFLTAQSSYPVTADLLHLHKNTVRYRVERAIEERGRPLADDRLELELALTACHWLGPTVLPDA